MINPKQITKFDRTQSELEEFLIFCVLVAGKNSTQAAQKTADLIEAAREVSHKAAPFDALRSVYADHCKGLASSFRDWLASVKVGQHNRFAVTFAELVTLSFLDTVTFSRLEKIHGIGPKTARFFCLHSNPNYTNLAVLDTHILKWLKQHFEDTPKSTPPAGKAYRKHELRWLDKSAELMPEISPAERDLTVWKSFAQK